MKSSIISVLLAGGLATSLAQVNIYNHSFTGSGGPLNGTPETASGLLWQAGPLFLDNGVVQTLVAPSANGQAAWLPFTPQNGLIYTATATILNNQPNWIAFGFMPTNPPGGLLWTNTNFQVRHSNNGAYLWALTRNSPTAQDQQAFVGPNATVPLTNFNGDLVDPTQPVTIQIVLDTTATTWTAEFFLNGVSRQTVNVPDAAKTAIGGIGFSRDRNASDNTGGVIQSFTLTVIPEPSAGALLILGLALLGLDRVRRVGCAPKC
ncbi:MAG: PEP-CTERM sorting domain-containing protein [Verrucomicrobiota bacterium]|nr:PEP-CTERM sorting domain-containing protein [Limisphaera sp.]MDW8380906.1 PEP-CTERM sorting domain-containing protein [Verrucomicrobiota bacterium]